MNELLRIQDLKTYFYTSRRVIKAVDGVTLDVAPGETVGIVGESGSGKSTLGLAILRLVPPPGRIVGGQISFNGEDLLSKSEADMRRYRGRRISMVPQDPMTSLNPVLSVGYQVAEPLRTHLALRGSSLGDRILELLRAVGIPSPESRIGGYPFEFSGGMRQRVVTAMALAGEPSILIADEPTTALDVTVQAQILTLLEGIQRDRNFSCLLITHDMGVVARLAQRVAVMYAGRIVESGPAERIFGSPKHPYTVGLLAALPRLGQRRDRLSSIEGQPPDLGDLPPGCRFAPRCAAALPMCHQQYPPETDLGGGQAVSCWLYEAKTDRRILTAPARSDPARSDTNEHESP